MSPVPDFTSSKSLVDYPPGTLIARSDGAAWIGLSLSVFSLQTARETFSMPAINEPSLVWIVSGRAETGERDQPSAPWSTTVVEPGSLFLTGAGAPYEFYWKRLSEEPFEVVMAVIELDLFECALRAVFGSKASVENFAMKDVSGIRDDTLRALLALLRQALLQGHDGTMFIQGLAHATAAHVAAHYCVHAGTLQRVAMLPNAKLRRAKAWLETHVDEEFSLARLAAQANMSPFHFSRLFHQTVGLSPSHYHTRLRVDEAKRLLRESALSIMGVAGAVGYSNPSHFARVFRKEAGLTPRQYRSTCVSHQRRS